MQSLIVDDDTLAGVPADREPAMIVLRKPMDERRTKSRFSTIFDLVSVLNWCFIFIRNNTSANEKQALKQAECC
jgi:hypothetical protein